MIILPPHLSTESLNPPNGGIDILKSHTSGEAHEESIPVTIIENDKELRYIDPVEVATHDKKGDIWMIIHGKVYDITTIIDTHPGGVEVLYDCGGIDATESFDDVSHSEYAYNMLKPFLLGLVKESEPKESQGEEFANPKGRRTSVGVVKRSKKKGKKKIIATTDDNINIEEVPKCQKKKPSNYYEFKREKERIRSLDEQKKLHQELLMKIYIISCIALALIGLVLFIYLQRRKWGDWIDWNEE